MSISLKDAVNFQEVHRVLLIKLRQLGDVLLTTPAFSVLKRQFPQMQLDALVYEEARPLLENNSTVNTVYSVDRKWKYLPLLTRLNKELELAWILRLNSYDLVINLTEGDRGALIAIASGARWRVGRYETHNIGFIGKQKTFTHLYQVQDERRHAVEQHLDALRRIGLRIPMGQEPLVLNIPEKSKQTAISKLQSMGWRNEPYILLSPTSRCIYKCLPASTVSEIINTLHRKGRKFVLTCGTDPEEIAMIDAILAGVRVPVFSLKGNLELLELGALISDAIAFMGSDSLPMHMAAALQIPSVVWFGPLQDVVWGPWLVQHRIVTIPVSCRPCGYEGCGNGMVAECLMELKAADIIKALKELLPKI